MDPLVHPAGLWFAVNMVWMCSICYFLQRLMKNLETAASGALILFFCARLLCIRAALLSIGSLLLCFRSLLMKNLETAASGALILRSFAVY